MVDCAGGRKGQRHVLPVLGEPKIRTRYGYTEHYGKITTFDPLGGGVLSCSV
jgi:hypothetical protein